MGAGRGVGGRCAPTHVEPGAGWSSLYVGTGQGWGPGPGWGPGLGQVHDAHSTALSMMVGKAPGADGGLPIEFQFGHVLGGFTANCIHSRAGA